MAARPWLFGDNFIANGVGQNYTLALIVAKFHLDALHANNTDPEIAAREVIFKTKYDALVNASTAKGVDTGDRIEDTATLKELFQTIRDIDLPLWQNQIAAVYPRKSPVFKGLFPNGTDTILKGRTDVKIKAVETLGAATAAKGLDDVSALIVAMFSTLDNKRNEQLGEKSSIKGLTGTQIRTIAEMCDAHFIDHGLVIMKYFNDPKKIASFTDVQSIQQHVHDSTYNGTVNGNKIKTALKHDFTLTSTFTVTSTVDVQVWVIDSANNIVKPTGVTVRANIPTVVGFPAAGNFVNRVVQVKNLTSTKGTYSIVVS